MLQGNFVAFSQHLKHIVRTVKMFDRLSFKIDFFVKNYRAAR